MLKNFLLVMAILLVGCTTMTVSDVDEAKCGPRPTEDQMQSAVHAYVEAAGFKDAESVRIQKVRIEKAAAWYRGVVNGGGYTYGWQIAFEVNAKNGFGAYVGYRSEHILRMPDGMVRWGMVHNFGEGS
jgi:hypothetical protein